MVENEATEERRKQKWRKLIPIFIPILVITILMTAADIISNSPQFRYSQWYSPILGLAIINVNIILILVLLVVIFRNLFKLFSERKRKILGSRFRTKLVLTMIAIALGPTLLLYITASDLISKSIDRWYSDPVGDIVSSSRVLSDVYLDDYKDLALLHARKMASYITDQNLLSEDKWEYLWRLYLEPEMESLGFDVVDVYYGDEPLIPTIVNPGSDFLPFLEDPDPAELISAINGKTDTDRHQFSVESYPVGTMVRCAVPVFNHEQSGGGSEPPGLVVVGFGVKQNLAPLADAISGDYKAFQEQVEQRGVIKLASQALLLVFMLMSLFSAIWIGIYFSKGITVPIQQLAEGTRAVAAGNLDYRIEPASTDELGSLVDSFNDMTRDLKESKDGLERANLDLVQTNLELERRRRYTETLLSNLSPAVFSLDAQGIVSTINPSARKLLALPERGQLGRKWIDALDRPEFEPLRDFISRFLDSQLVSAGQELEIRLDQQILHLSAAITVIRHDDGTLRGTLIVLDDLTQLVRAQRTAAWREVAQRIAHEIKNPLTPIQLSAERIRRRIRDGIGDDQKLISDCTETIIEETGTLKSMVDAFSSFARMPPVQLVRADVNSVVEKATSIYHGDGDGFSITKRLEPEMPEIDLDPDQLKMAFVNIINNAIDAMDGQGGLEVSTRYDKDRGAVVVEFNDEGPGIPAEVKEKLFIPYFSTKKKGTGLGLAIVHRVISDHNGTIAVDDNEPRGSKFTIELPVE